MSTKNIKVQNNFIKCMQKPNKIVLMNSKYAETK